MVSCLSSHFFGLFLSRQSLTNVTESVAEATGRPVTVVAVGPESITLANEIAASVKKLVPSLEGIILKASEDGVHDLLWSLGPNVQYLIVVWPDDVRTRTCGVTAITASSDGSLIFFFTCQA